MRKDKEYVFKLRQEGKSYREIQRLTGVSRATLSTWFKDIPWSKHLTQEHSQKIVGASQERMMRMNMVRKLKLQYAYALVESEAAKEYAVFRNDPLFWAGLMIYAGEGDRRSRGLVRISNTEFYLHRIFIAFCLKYLLVEEEKIKFALILYPDHSEVQCKEVWVRELGLPNLVFHKTQIIKGKDVKKRLQYGIGMSIIPSVSLKKKLLTWLSLSEKEVFDDAVMVQG